MRAFLFVKFDELILIVNSLNSRNSWLRKTHESGFNEINAYLFVEEF